jgi:hypothetical protein
VIFSDLVPDADPEAEPVKKASRGNRKSSSSAKKKSASTKAGKAAQSTGTDGIQEGQSIAQLLAAGEQVLVRFF